VASRPRAGASCLRVPREERIPVGAPRRARRPAQHSRSGVVDASGAGLTLIVLVAIVAALGALIGHQVGLELSGAIAGTTLGLPAAFAAIYLRYRNL
jgi:3-oxoacyl-(acyl-carrier-protein) synthase